MRKLECMLLLLLLCSVGMNAQKTVKPKVSFVTDKAVKVQSVEVTDTETILDITSEGDWWSLDSGTKLIFPNAENKVCSLTVKRVESGDRFCKFNTQYEVPNRAIRLKIHFPRLPAGVDNINLSEPGGWGITGISIKTTTSAPFATQKNEETVSAQGNASSAQRGNATASTQTQGGFAMAAAQGTKTPARTQAASLLPKPQGHDYVDLGLPSKTLWATMNIGATKPEQVGGYFAWGETKPKQNYTWETYKFYKKDTSKPLMQQDRMTKYCTTDHDGVVDNKIELEAMDDAATQNWGAGWRMPSEKQWDELCDNCKWVKRKLADKTMVFIITGPNAQVLVLPCGGYRYNTSFANNTGEADAFYWSRTLHTFTGAHEGTELSNKMTSLRARRIGLPVRAVWDPTTAPERMTPDRNTKGETAGVEEFLAGQQLVSWAAKVDEARKLMYRPVPDYAKAISLLTEAAEHGDTNAQWMLAQLYLEGKHTTRDISKAWNYATASSKEGNPIGAFWLSVLYEHGEGMTMGAVERTQRADALFKEAQTALERMAKRGKSSTNQDGNALKAEQFIQKADMFETLGRMLEQEGKESDALDWYGKAADEGSRYAQKQMGDWMMTGCIDGILRLADKTADNKALKPQQDRMKTTEYYRKAANQGDVDAQNMLGILLVQQYRNQTTSYGRAFSKDLLTEAKANFQYAADQRNIDALYNLGYCYENGYGCTKDKNKAVLHYQMAAGSGHKKAEEHLMEMR